MPNNLIYYIMKRIRFILCLALAALFMNAKAEVRFNLRGGLSLVNNDISMITTENVQNEDFYGGFFVGPVLSIEAPHLLGLDLGVFYQQNKMNSYDINGNRDTYRQEFLEIPLSLKLKFGLKNLKIIGQLGPQWNINLGDVQTFVEDGEEINGDKVIATANLGAGVRLFDKLELMMNFNVPWKVVGDNFNDFDKMGDLIGKYKTIQFVVGWRF